MKLQAEYKNIFVRSMQKSRCIQTAQAVIKGLFGYSEKANNLTFQYVPVISIPLEDDYLLHAFYTCPLIFDVRDTLRDTLQWIKWRTSQELIDYQKMFNSTFGVKININNWEGKKKIKKIKKKKK
jgi:hypothetical protein